jgi:hypothetical protein
VVDESEKLREKQLVKLKSMCRAYDEASIKTLGSYASEPTVDPLVRITAIKILLERGHGTPKNKKQKKEHSGTINLVMRQIHEGKPPGET